MMLQPRLLHNNNTVSLQDPLFSDLQIDKLLSASAISVLKCPCEKSELAKRNELFALLDDNGNLERVKRVLSVLLAMDKALCLLRDSKLSLDRYYRYAEVLEAYAESCEALIVTSDLGDLFSEVAGFYSSAEKTELLDGIKKSAQEIRSLLEKMNSGLLSFADKDWLTPDCDAVSDFDNIAICAEGLGFAIPKKKAQSIKINISLSDTLCRLYAFEAEQIEAEIERYADVDLCAPTAYIGEIKFYLEIHGLVQRAAEKGVPHCIARIASEPLYTAKEAFDVSLLAKKCEMIVPNDADFTKNEPFYFLLGANGGGKTTYLRAVGINLILFLSGCPVFTREAEIYPFDTVISHFPKDERFDSVGRLDEERRRTEEMLSESQNKSAFLLFNETFSGTDDKRGFELLVDVADRVGENKNFGLYVTHFHEVMYLDCSVLSAEVDLTDANKRTFRIVKSKGNVSSYACDILKKYQLDKSSLERRRCENGN